MLTKKQASQLLAFTSRQPRARLSAKTRTIFEQGTEVLFVSNIAISVLNVFFRSRYKFVSSIFAFEQE